MAKKEENVVKIQVEAKNPPKRKARAPRAKGPSPAINNALIENTVAMQKVYSIIAEKLDKLSTQLSTLLNLFETAAKSFAENPALQVFGRDKEFIDKMNKLLEQDKIIARTLVMMQEKMAGRAEQIIPISPQAMSVQAASAPSPEYAPSPYASSASPPQPKPQQQ